jgi:hypothetical protein
VKISYLVRFKDLTAAVMRNATYWGPCSLLKVSQCFPKQKISGIMRQSGSEIVNGTATVLLQADSDCHFSVAKCWTQYWKRHPHISVFFVRFETSI